MVVGSKQDRKKLRVLTPTSPILMSLNGEVLVVRVNTARMVPSPRRGIDPVAPLKAKTGATDNRLTPPPLSDLTLTSMSPVFVSLERDTFVYRRGSTGLTPYPSQGLKPGHPSERPYCRTG